MLSWAVNWNQPQDSSKWYIGECNAKGDVCEGRDLIHVVAIPPAILGRGVCASIDAAWEAAVAVFILHTLDDLRPLRDEVRGVRFVRFLLAVFQTLALVIL